MPIADRWRWRPADEDLDDALRVPLWRGGNHAGADARAAGFAYAKLGPPVALTLLEVDEVGNLGAFEWATPDRAVLLDMRTPATVAAVDASDGGPPWLTLTLAAVLAARRIAVVLPTGAGIDDVAPDGSAFAAVRRHARVPLVCHGVG